MVVVDFVERHLVFDGGLLVERRLPVVPQPFTASMSVSDGEVPEVVVVQAVRD
jgi:hypothetical protein